MAGINDINPPGYVWPTTATRPSAKVRDRKQAPKRQPQQQDKDEKKDDDQPHIDEYA